MNKFTSVLLSALVLIIAPGFTGNTTLSAQTWTSIDGGGATYGINSTTATNSIMPSCAVYNNELYAIWEELPLSQIHIKKYNGTTWVGVGNIPGQSQLNTSTEGASNPKLITYNGYLYAAWNECDAGDPNIPVIHVKRYNGSTWAFVQDYTTGENRHNINKETTLIAGYVDLAVYNGKLYAAWLENANTTYIYQLRVSEFDGSLWTSVDGNGQYGLNYATTNNLFGIAPSLCVYNNYLYVAWLEIPASTSQLFIKRYDGSSVWTLVGGSGGVGLNYSTGASTPNLTSGNNKLYAFWKESNKVRVKQYDGSGWTTDPDGIGWVHTGTYSYNPFGYHFVNLNYIAWEDNVSAVRQIRVVSFDGTTKTYIDGDGTLGINQNTAYTANDPVLTECNGDLFALWQEYNNAEGSSGAQIRAKKYPLPPFVESVNVPANGTYISGQTLTFTVNYSKDVVVTGGTPYIPITLNTGGTVNATYTGGSGTSALTFSYTVVSGNGDTDGISVGTTISNGGATLQSEDATPLTANLTLNSVSSTTGILVDAIGPTVISVSSTNIDGYYNAGDEIAITITCSEAATVTGTPTLALNSGGTASYALGSGTTALTFSYIVASGQNIADLDYAATSALSLSGGTIKDGTGNDATLILPTVGGASSLGGQKDIVIDNTTPTASISSTATDPTNASTFIVTINFSESVTGLVVGDISVTNGTAGSFTKVTSYLYTASITPTAAGTVTVNVAGSVAIDAAGNNNTAAAALTRVYDNVAPAAPTISGISTGSFNTNQTFTVSGEAGATIEYSTNNGGLWTAYSGAVTLSAEGTYNVLARQTDQAGNGPTSSGVITLTVDKTAPSAPTITGISAGYFNSNQTFTVSGESGATIEYSTNNGGLWIAYSGAVTLSAEGTYNVLARQTDQAGNGPTSSGVITLTVDKTAPSAPTITGISAGYFNSNQTFTVSGEAGATIEYSTNNVGLWTAYSGAVTLSAEGTYNVLARQTDQAGNGPTSSGVITLTIDKTAPTVIITSTATDPTNASIPVTITFDESVTGFDAEDITVINGTKGILSGSGAIYNISITPIAQGVVTINLATGVAQDASGNGNTAATQFSRTYDGIPPSVVVSSLVLDPTNNKPISVSIVFSEEVTGFDMSDVQLGNATASDLETIDNIHWTVTVSPSHMGAFTVEVAAGTVLDMAGNGNTASAYFQRTYDPNAPTVTLSSTSPDPTNDNPIVVNIALSESSWNLLDISKIVVGNGTASNLQLLPAGYHENWTVDIYPSADGLVTVDIPAGAVQDYAGNDNIAATQFSRTCDITSPTVAISSTASESTNTSPIPVTFTFNEPVTGFVEGDITVTNGTAVNFSGSGTTYTADITPSGQGAVTVNVAAGVAQDALGNNNIAATQLSRTFDNIVPAVLSVSSSTDDGAYKTGDIIAITTTFSETVILTGNPTLELNSGGTASYVSGSGSSILTFSYTVASGNNSVDLDYSTSNALSLAGGTLTDEAGNAAIITLPEVGGSNSLGGQKNIVIGTVSAVTTQAVTDIVSTTATGNGNITDLGNPNPIAHGVCWNTTGAPDISDSKADNGAVSLTGSFTASMTGLASGTTFYVRAYVTNIVSTCYGDEVSFTTNGIITYNLNGGTNHVANTDNYVYGTGLALSDPTRTGYTFGGWYDNETFTGSAITAISSTAKGDVTLYARWNPATGVNDINSTGITLYPNPAKDVVFIKGAKGFVNIYDANSHLVLTKQIDDSSSIDISSLAHGVYFVIINNKNYKLIKE